MHGNGCPTGGAVGAATGAVLCRNSAKVLVNDVLMPQPAMPAMPAGASSSWTAASHAAVDPLAPFLGSQAAAVAPSAAAAGGAIEQGAAAAGNAIGRKAGTADGLAAGAAAAASQAAGALPATTGANLGNLALAFQQGSAPAASPPATAGAADVAQTVQALRSGAGTPQLQAGRAAAVAAGNPPGGDGAGAAAAYAQLTQRLPAAQPTAAAAMAATSTRRNLGERAARALSPYLLWLGGSSPASSPEDGMVEDRTAAAAQAAVRPATIEARARARQLAAVDPTGGRDRSGFRQKAPRVLQGITAEPDLAHFGVPELSQVWKAVPLTSLHL